MLKHDSDLNPGKRRPPVETAVELIRNPRNRKCGKFDNKIILNTGLDARQKKYMFFT